MSACHSKFLALKEEEEERNNVFYAQTTGRKVLSDSTYFENIGKTISCVQTITYIACCVHIIE